MNEVTQYLGKTVLGTLASTPYAIRINITCNIFRNDSNVIFKESHGD